MKLLSDAALRVPDYIRELCSTIGAEAPITGSYRQSDRAILFLTNYYIAAAALDREVSREEAIALIQALREGEKDSSDEKRDGDIDSDEERKRRNQNSESESESERNDEDEEDDGEK